MASEPRAETGFYCSTSGTYFADKESLSEHYKSDFHRYNLKRKVAGLPPITLEWFEARKTQLSQASAADQGNKVWMDPLTKKKFSSENTYDAHVRSKKYLDLVKKSGEPAPEAVIIVRSAPTAHGDKQFPVQKPEPQAAGFTEKPAAGSFVAKKAERAQQERQNNQAEARAEGSAVEGDKQEGETEKGNDSGWETASDDEEWEEWDVCRSLMDNHLSPSVEANLEYMYKKFGFYFPDAQYLHDPEGLLRYLGAKLQHGRVPLYTAGEDENAKQFRSLHAIQRHMVDTNQCKMLYEGNEEEYAEFYDYQEPEGAEGEAGQQLVVAGEEPSAAALAGYELVLPGRAGASSGKILGSRDLARYYRQKHKPEDGRQSIAVNTVLAQYRRLAISTKEEGTSSLEMKQSKKNAYLAGRSMITLYMRSNINRNLPKNVTY